MQKGRPLRLGDIRDGVTTSRGPTRGGLSGSEPARSRPRAGATVDRTSSRPPPAYHPPSGPSAPPSRVTTGVVHSIVGCSGTAHDATVSRLAAVRGIQSNDA